MKRIIFTAILILSGIGMQGQAYWLGGTHGSENSWMEARNWSTGRAPGWKDDVVIPYRKHGFYPEINCVAPLIQTLAVEKGAVLTLLPEGVLTVDAAATDGDGILLDGHILNYGALILTEMKQLPVERQLDNLDNHGICTLVTDAGHVPLYALENQ